MLISSQRIWKDRLYAFKHYYQGKFALIDLCFGLIALFINPYRVCRKFLKKKGVENVYAYGETPFSTYQKIVEECGIDKNDVWVELGAGRGKGCFWLKYFVGCRVVGVEWVPLFVWIANGMKSLFRMKGIRFEKRDLVEIDLKEASFVYLYGVHREVPAGIKVLSVSEPLPGYKVIKSFWVRYPWGRTRVFLQKNPK